MKAARGRSSFLAKSSQEVYRELAREMNLLVRLTRQLPSAAAN